MAAQRAGSHPEESSFEHEARLAVIFGALDTQVRHELGQTTRRLQKGMRVAASGLRVGRAADDSAGLAVADGLRAVVRSKQMAQRNIQDGLSALDMADGGLREITQGLHRLGELATQGASETLDTEARLGLQLEAEGILGHITSLATGTTWQGKPLLAQRVVDVGLIIDLSGSMGGELNKVKQEITTFKETFRAAGLNVSMGLAIMGRDRTDGVSRVTDIGDAAFARELEDLAIIGAAPMEPYSALLNASGARDFAGDDDADAFGWHDIATQKVMVVVTDTGRETSYLPATQASVGAELAALDIEVHAITHPSKVGSFSTITGATGGGTYNIGPPNGNLIGAALSTIAASLLSIPAEDPMSLQVSHGSGDESRIELGVPANVTSLALGIEDMDLLTASGSQDALDTVQAALDLVNSARSKVGASENRLLGALSTEETATEALLAAESRIRDADYAQVAARLAKDQILAQAAIAVAGQLRETEAETMRALLEL